MVGKQKVEENTGVEGHWLETVHWQECIRSVSKYRQPESHGAKVFMV